jgi:formate hydrogenlyase subunit 4
MSSISLILIIAISLFFSGIVIRTKSILSGRKGPGILQPLKDIWRLFRKGTVYSETSSFIFRIAPSIYFSTVIMAIFLIPFDSYPGILSFRGDFVFFCLCTGARKIFYDNRSHGYG